MARRSLLFLFISGLILTTSCGKKGPIEPPLVRVPQAVEDHALIQRGATLWLTWTNPSAYVDGSPLGEVAEVEIWMIKEDRRPEGGRKTWTAEEFESKAQLLARIGKDQFASLIRADAKKDQGLTYVYALAKDDFGRKIFTFSLRVRDAKKRASGFAAPISLEAVAPLAPPRNVRAMAFEDHIQVSWEAPQEAGKEGPASKPAGFNVYRADGQNPALRLNSAPLLKSEFRDNSFLFGTTYRYFVRSVLESTPPTESDDSETAEVIPKDVFPPAPPSGLTAIGGPGFIALSWEPGREPDLAGYRVWRMTAGEGDFVPVASLPATDSSFSDSKVEKGRKYDYAITALDSAGNESQKSAAVAGTARDETL